MKVWKIMFVNWLCCLITGAVLGFVLTVLFSGAISGTIISMITAAAGYLVSFKVMKILRW